MSKIQEALRKIQGSRAGLENSKPETEVDLTERLGEVVVKRGNSESAEQHAQLSEKPSRLVQVDNSALQNVGLLAPKSDEHALAGEYRNIKRPLVAHAFGKRATKIPDGHMIMVTSAVSGEGKTFTCINLSLSIAQEQDVSVLLVDADLAKPHITNLFGLQDEPGLLDLLDGSVPSLEPTILDTSIPGLKILPAGLPRQNATELLASKRMESLMGELHRKAEDRIVLFDSPPLLLTSEARVLASLVGQIVMVVKAGDTSQQAVLEGLATLPENKAINLILNQARLTGINSYYYGSGSKYGYGYGGGYGSNPKASKQSL